MVSVPVTPGRSVQVQGQPRERFRYAESRNFVGRAVEQAGAALGQAAEDWNEIKATYDTAAAKKADLGATNEKRELLWTGPDAFFTKKGFAAGDARPSNEEAFAKINERYASELGNDDQRQMFARAASVRDGSDLEKIAAYATKEYDTEFEAVSVARRDAFQADAIRYADDPAAYAEQIAGGLSEIEALARQQNWVEERQTAEEEKFVSGAHFMSVNGMLAGTQNDAAIAFFERHRDEMLPRDEQALLEKLTPVIEFRADEIEVTMALANAPAPEPGAPADAGSSLSVQLSAIESNESGGKQFDASGKTLTSRVGALGVMQIMPGTGPEAARLAGLPWSLEKMKTDPAYNRALGAAYYKEQLRRFGDPAMAAAAYNAGPGAMQSARLKARKAGTPDDWVKHLLPETRDYVAKFRRKTGAVPASGGGAATTNFSGAYAALEEKAQREKWAPEVLERRRKRLDQRVDREVQLQKLQENEQWDVTLETVDALRKGFTSISQIPN